MALSVPLNINRKEERRTFGNQPAVCQPQRLKESEKQRETNNLQITIKKMLKKICVKTIHKVSSSPFSHNSKTGLYLFAYICGFGVCINNLQETDILIDTQRTAKQKDITI